MKTYAVTSFSGVDYTVKIGEQGVVEVDGLLPTSAETLRLSVERNMKKYHLTPVQALNMAVGSYASLSVAD